MYVGLGLKKSYLGGYQVTNCSKCKEKCTPIYRLSSPNSCLYVCRVCALLIMEEYYDRRPDKIEESN